LKTLKQQQQVSKKLFKKIYFLKKRKTLPNLSAIKPAANDPKIVPSKTIVDIQAVQIDF